MKRSTFMLIGMLLTVLAIGMMSCDMRSPSEKNAYELAEQSKEKSRVNTAVVLENSQTKPVVIEAIASLRETMHYVNVIDVEGVEYVVVSGYKGGVAIIKHEPVERPKVDMDSVVANSPWIPEYTMLGYDENVPKGEIVYDSIVSYNRSKPTSVSIQGVGSTLTAQPSKESLKSLKTPEMNPRISLVDQSETL